MLITQVDFMSPFYDECVRLRYDILRAPLKLNFEVEQLEKEYIDYHIACYDLHFNLMGCMVLTPHGVDKIKMRQVAVDEKYQRHGIGKKMTVYAEELSSELGFSIMYCHARKNAVPFYAKMGYKEVGKPFKEVNIPHMKMEKQIKH